MYHRLTNKMADDKTQDEVFYKDLRSFRRLLLNFVVLFLIGIFIVELVRQSTNLKVTVSKVYKSGFETLFHKPKQTFSGLQVKKQLSSSRQNTLDNDSLAQYLQRKVRILCWALVQPNQLNYTIHLKQTWGKRCNQFVLISTATNGENNMTTVLNTAEAKSDNSWFRTVAIYKYLYASYKNTSDWIYRADDFTYTIMENLRLMLYPYSPQTAIYFGCRFNGWPKRGYTGGFGSILSKEALRRLVELNSNNSKICGLETETEKLSDIDEYVELEKCLKNLNVSVGNTRDKNGGRKYLPTRFQIKLMPQEGNFEEWAIEYSFYKLYEGINCCSKHFVTFHYVTPSLMYTFEYLLYYLRPYGVANKHDLLPPKLMLNELEQRRK